MKLLYTSNLLTAVSILAFAASTNAADLTVEQGDSITLADGDSYDAIVVNGTLVIPENAAITAASLVVATNIAGDAYVTLEPNSKLTLSGEVHLGYDGGQAHLNVKSGASLTVGGDFYMAYGHTATPTSGATPTRAYFTISNATAKVSGSNGLYFFHSDYWPSGDAITVSMDTVRLETGATLNCNRIQKGAMSSNRKGKSSSIVFAGGRAEGGTWSSSFIQFNNSAKGAALYFESEGDNPVHFKRTTKTTCWFSLGTKDAAIRMSGRGDFVLENDYTSSGVDVSLVGSSATYWDANNPNVRFLSEGRIVLTGWGSLKNSHTNAFAAFPNKNIMARSLVLKNKAQFDMNGLGAEFLSIDNHDGRGIVNSKDVACSLTVGSDNADNVYPSALPSTVQLVKKGSGTLSVLATDMESLSASEGAVSLMSRREIGYPFYKFNIYGTLGTGIRNHQIKISEFKYLNGETDVTQGWDSYIYSNTDTSYYNQPTNMWDGNLATEFHDQRDQNWATVSNCAPILEYQPSRKVTGYTWYTSCSADYHTRLTAYPTNWAVFGSENRYTWTRLDIVERFTAPSTAQGAWVQTNFMCHYETPATTIGALALSGGTMLTVDGADVTVSSVTTASGIPLALAHDAALMLPENVEIVSLSLNLDNGGGTLENFRPSQGGGIYLSGGNGRIRGRSLPVSVGNLLGNNLQSWRVFRDGIRVRGVRVAVGEDGHMKIYAGMTMSFK